MERGGIAADSLAGAVERMVCDVVSGEFMSVRPFVSASVDVGQLYACKKNVPAAVATARHFCFYVMKDVYGFTYSYIAERAGMRIGSVMKSVRKIRYGVFFDPFLIGLHKKIGKRLEDGIL